MRSACSHMHDLQAQCPCVTYSCQTEPTAHVHTFYALYLAEKPDSQHYAGLGVVIRDTKWSHNYECRKWCRSKGEGGTPLPPPNQPLMCMSFQWNTMIQLMWSGGSHTSCVNQLLQVNCVCILLNSSLQQPHHYPSYHLLFMPHFSLVCNAAKT